MTLKVRINKVLRHPSPGRYLMGKVINRLGLFSYPTRVRMNAEGRPEYAYCILSAANLAKALGLRKISAIEFGVAGGNGLIMAEYHAKKAEDETGVEVEVYGFDTGEGLPNPVDYRDIPYVWKSGFYRMDQEALKQRLTRAKLVLGNVKDTVKDFFANNEVAPVGCIFHDLDFYSSTKDSFRIFDLESHLRLPRIFNYFDDILGNELALYNDYTGERLAIAEYNTQHEHSKIAKSYEFLDVAPFPWHNKIFVHHDFQHPDYCKYIGSADLQNRLEG